MNDKETVEKLMEELYNICEQLNWTVSFDNSTETVRGMVVGSDEYINDIYTEQEDFAEYIILGIEEKQTQLH